MIDPVHIGLNRAKQNQFSETAALLTTQNIPCPPKPARGQDRTSDAVTIVAMQRNYAASI